MGILSSPVSVRTLCGPPSSLPTCSPSLVVHPHNGTEVPEPPLTSALLPFPPAAPRLPLLVVRVTARRCRQRLPRQPQRRLRQRGSVFISLEELSEASSAPLSSSSSVLQRGMPSLFIEARHTVMWRQPAAVKLFRAREALMPKLPVLWEMRAPPLGFVVHVVPEGGPVLFGLFSGAAAPLRRTPVQFCADFWRIKVWFVPREPPEKGK